MPEYPHLNNLKTYFDFLASHHVIVYSFLLIFILELFLLKDKKSLILSTFSNFFTFAFSLILFLTFSFCVASDKSFAEFVYRFRLFDFDIFAYSSTLSVFLFVLFVLFFDFLNYWLHRAYHKFDFLWAFHAVHHSDTRLTASTVLRISFSAYIFSFFVYFFMIMLGASWDIIVTIISTIYLQHFLTHSEVFKNKFPNIFSKIIVTPETHLLHHTKKYNDKNLGFVFPFWDRIFGTYKEVGKKEWGGLEYGVTDLSNTNNFLKVNLEPLVIYIKKLFKS